MNALNREIKIGERLVIKVEKMDEEKQELKDRIFVAQDGFGMQAYTSGTKIFGYFETRKFPDNVTYMSGMDISVDETNALKNKSPKPFLSDVANVQKSKARKSGQPDFVLAQLRSTSDGKTMEVIAIRYGERGYHRTDYGRQTMQWVDDENAKMGIDEATMLAFETCSLFGRWDNFDEIERKMKAKVIHV